MRQLTVEASTQVWMDKQQRGQEVIERGTEDARR